MDIKNIPTLILADFTADPFAQSLNANDAGVGFQARTGPFDQVAQALLDPSHTAWEPHPDLLIVWTRPEGAVAEFSRFVDGALEDEAAVLAGVDRFAGLIRAASDRVEAIFIPAWTRPAHLRGLGLLQMRPGQGEAQLLMRMNLRLAESLADLSHVHLLDAARWQALCGARAFNEKMWRLGKLAFTPELFAEATRDVVAGVAAIAGQSRKIILLDLDDTLWGGILGEVGWERVTLGGHNPVGEAFLDFQRALKRLKNRGVLLAILSKNEESTALEALEEHPEMLLRPDDFIAWRINWGDKGQNAIELLAEVNLLPHSAVFIDDQPAERARVREALPEALVPDWPKDKMLYGPALEALACFDAARLTHEDAERTASYAAERRRRDAQTSATSPQEWLDALELTIQVEPLGEANLTRSTQLLNKTNQMNLRTRRLGEGAFLDWARQTGNRCLVFRVADRFGDYGLTGVASLTLIGDQVEIVDFLLSCRVMGRGVEATMLHALVEEGRRLGAKRLLTVPITTPRNKPCLDFFQQRSGLDWRSDAGESGNWDLSIDYPCPGHVALSRIG